LLGQNVNSYGRDVYGEPRFAEVLRAVASTGIARIRFATSHPRIFPTRRSPRWPRSRRSCRTCTFPCSRAQLRSWSG
jgi:hypothetical protein